MNNDIDMTGLQWLGLTSGEDDIAKLWPTFESFVTFIYSTHAQMEHHKVREALKDPNHWSKLPPIGEPRTNT